MDQAPIKVLEATAVKDVPQTIVEHITTERPRNPGTLFIKVTMVQRGDTTRIFGRQTADMITAAQATSGVQPSRVNKLQLNQWKALHADKHKLWLLV